MYVSPFTLNVPSDWMDALTAPLTILFNSNPVTPEAGILYKPAPSPTKDEDITEAVIGPLKFTLYDVSQIDPVNANKLSPDEPLVPDVPLVPLVPEVPEVPDEPSLPDVPEVPEVPEVPDVPDVPLVPELPLVPLVPEVPDEPSLPEEPLVPEEPDVPEEPLPPTVAITVPVCAMLKYTFKLLLSST